MPPNQYPEEFNPALMIPLGLLLGIGGGSVFMLLGLSVEAFIRALVALLCVLLLVIALGHKGSKTG